MGAEGDGANKGDEGDEVDKGAEGAEKAECADMPNCLHIYCEMVRIAME